MFGQIKKSSYQQARKYNRDNHGFSFTELMTVLIIIGIIAAVAIPNLLGLFNRQRVNEAIVTVVGAIKETQRQAMRQGKRCRININPSTKILSATPAGCLLNNRTIDKNVIIRTNLSGATPNISFSYKGNTTKMGTIVLSSNFTDTQKCFVISLGLGIMRTGNYIGSKNGSVSANYCKKE
jgi:prepilin-type N-terminal cleavage/methylation domain-containing protein